jgi:hypothetical protein
MTRNMRRGVVALSRPSSFSSVMSKQAETLSRLHPSNDTFMQYVTTLVTIACLSEEKANATRQSGPTESSLELQVPRRHIVSCTMSSFLMARLTTVVLFVKRVRDLRHGNIWSRANAICCCNPLLINEPTMKRWLLVKSVSVLWKTTLSQRKHKPHTCLDVSSHPQTSYHLPWASNYSRVRWGGRPTSEISLHDCAIALEMCL